MKWVNPLDLYKAIREGTADEQSLMQYLEEVQRKAARVINPVAAETPFNQPIIPTTKSFVDLNLPGNSTIILIEDSTIAYENFYCEILEESVGAFDVTPNIEVVCNNSFVGYAHSNASFTVPGAIRWELKNIGGTPRRITCYVRSAIIQHSGGLVPSLLMGQTASSPTGFRPAKISSNTERLAVSFSNAAGDINAGNGELWITHQETDEVRGRVSGKGNPVNQNVALAPASTSLMIVALGLIEFDHIANIGDTVTARWHFSGGGATVFHSQQIATGIAGGGVDGRDWIVFGPTGPTGNPGTHLQVDIAHVSGAAPGDGWEVFALCREITGF